MKIVVVELKKLSPFISLFTAKNKLGRQILEEMGKKYFTNSDLFVLQKLGFEIINKTHK